jgi:hypothetical protein
MKRKKKVDGWFSDKPKRRRRRSSGGKRRRGGALSATERVGAEAFSGKLD